MNEQIKKLARELFQIAYETTWTWEQVSKHEHAIWIKMAKFVLERELEARIQEISPYILFGGVSEKISRLHNQLQQLRAIK